MKTMIENAEMRKWNFNCGGNENSYTCGISTRRNLCSHGL